jgi:hypothetical protein
MTVGAFVLANLVASALAAVELYDDFTTYNNSVFAYADNSMGTTDDCKVWSVVAFGVQPLIFTSLRMERGGATVLSSSYAPQLKQQYSAIQYCCRCDASKCPSKPGRAHVSIPNRCCRTRFL